MSTTACWNHTYRCCWTASRACRNYTDHYGTNVYRFFSSISNSYVHHHSNSSSTTMVNSEQQDHQSRWDTRTAAVYPDIISEDEETNLLSILTTKFQRRRYEQGHWDSVIKNYREVELYDEETDDLKLLLQPIRKFIEERYISGMADPTNGDSTLYFSGTWLPCHAIDLHQDGELNAHVDSVRFSGNLVAGLSLLSDAIMRLKRSCDSKNGSDEKGDIIEKRNAGERNEYIDMLLPRRSLYVLSGMSRYEYSHELLPSGSRFQRTSPILRGRRLSVIFRDSKVQNN